MIERKGGDHWDPKISEGYALGYKQGVTQAAEIAALSDSLEHAVVSIRKLLPQHAAVSIRELPKEKVDER